MSLLTHEPYALEDPVHTLCVSWHCTQAVINSSLVHHMILYACSTPPPTLGVAYNCGAQPLECPTYTLGELLKGHTIPETSELCVVSLRAGFDFRSLVRGLNLCRS